jgi:hypothetical protein
VERCAVLAGPNALPTRRFPDFPESASPHAAFSACGASAPGYVFDSLVFVVTAPTTQRLAGRAGGTARLRGTAREEKPSRVRAAEPDLSGRGRLRGVWPLWPLVLHWRTPSLRATPASSGCRFRLSSDVGAFGPSCTRGTRQMLNRQRDSARTFRVRAASQLTRSAGRHARWGL